MFYQYHQMWQRLRKHYMSQRVLICLATGMFVPPINRKVLYSLQYSMLPKTRVGIMEMWDTIKRLSISEQRKGQGGNRKKYYKYNYQHYSSSLQSQQSHHGYGDKQGRGRDMRDSLDSNSSGATVSLLPNGRPRIGRTKSYRQSDNG